MLLGSWTNSKIGHQVNGSIIGKCLDNVDKSNTKFLTVGLSFASGFLLEGGLAVPRP